MILEVTFDGCKKGKTHDKGVDFVEIYFREFDADGVIDFEQKKFRSYDAGVMGTCGMLASGDIINLDIDVRDAYVRGVQKV